jgi:hypothetical protein
MSQLRGFVILGVLTAMSSCSVPRTTPIDEPSTLEGLQRVEVPGIEAVYRRPGSDLAHYDKLLLHPVQIAFSKNWEREQDSPLHGLSREDRDRIKREVSDAFAEVFQHEIETKGGYQLVSEPGSDVLDVQPGIFNLYITAPDTSMQPGRGKTYATSAGEMTLVAELRDSVTGELLGRAYDRRRGADLGWQWTNSMTNTAEGKRIILSWAIALRKALDASRGKAASGNG